MALNTKHIPEYMMSETAFMAQRRKLSELVDKQAAAAPKKKKKKKKASG